MILITETGNAQGVAEENKEKGKLSYISIDGTENNLILLYLSH